MREIDNLVMKGYIIIHNQIGTQWGEVSNTTAKAKRRFTNLVQSGGFANRYGVPQGVRFDDQHIWGLYQMINPVVLMEFLETSGKDFPSVDELVEFLKQEISRAKIK